MYKLTLTSLRYGETESVKEYSAANQEELTQLKESLFISEDIINAVEVEYSFNGVECTKQDNWNEVYWNFEGAKDSDIPKWGYVIEVKEI